MQFDLNLHVTQTTQLIQIILIILIKKIATRWINWNAFLEQKTETA